MFPIHSSDFSKSNVLKMKNTDLVSDRIQALSRENEALRAQIKNHQMFFAAASKVPESKWNNQLEMQARFFGAEATNSIKKRTYGNSASDDSSCNEPEKDLPAKRKIANKEYAEVSEVSSGGASEAMLRENSLGLKDHYQHGYHFYKQENYSQALLHFREALMVDPGLYLAALYTGVIYYRMDDLDKADLAFVQAISIDAGKFSAFSYRALIACRRGSYATAACFAELSLRLNPNQPELTEIVNRLTEGQ